MFENDANSSPSQNDEHSNSSTEYRALEEAVVNDFRRELEHLEDLLDGEEGN